MNLLILVSDFPDRGNKYLTNIFVKEQIRAIANFVDEINVIVPIPAGIERKRNTNYENYKLGTNINIHFVKYFNPIFPVSYHYIRSHWIWAESNSIIKYVNKKNLKYNLVHAHFTWPSGAVAIELKKATRVPVIITEHASSRFKKAIDNGDKIYLNAWKNCDAIIRVNKNDITKLSSFGVSGKVHYIPNGFSEDKFMPIPIDKARQSLDLPLNKKIILSVGLLYSKAKGHIYLIEAMKKVIELRNDVVCVIVGDGLFRKDLERQIIKLNLRNYVRIVGSRPHDEIPIWMNAADLFVLPSLSESFGIVQIEAMACGKPIIATYNGGSEEIIKSEKLGLLCRSGDSLDLAEKILIGLDRSWNETLIEQYAQQYSWSNISRQIVQLYGKL